MSSRPNRSFDFKAIGPYGQRTGKGITAHVPVEMDSKVSGSHQIRIEETTVQRREEKSENPGGLFTAAFLYKFTLYREAVGQRVALNQRFLI